MKQLEQLEEKNELLNPKKFVEEKARLEKAEELLKIIVFFKICIGQHLNILIS